MRREAEPKNGYLVVNSDTGEVVDRLEHAPKKKRAPAHYLKVFYSDPLLGSCLPNAARTILFALASKMPYSNSGFPLSLSTSAKKKIAEEYGMNVASIDRCLPFLQKHKYIYRVAKGEYLINPHLFGKGPAGAILERQVEWDALVGVDDRTSEAQSTEGLEIGPNADIQ